MTFEHHLFCILSGKYWFQYIIKFLLLFKNCYTHHKDRSVVVGGGTRYQKYVRFIIYIHHIWMKNAHWILFRFANAKMPTHMYIHYISLLLRHCVTYDDFYSIQLRFIWYGLGPINRLVQIFVSATRRVGTEM